MLITFFGMLMVRYISRLLPLQEAATG